MAKRTQYSNMSTSDLARLTRERGLVKPEGLMDVGEWADWLAQQDKPVMGEPVTDAEAAALPPAEVEVASPYAAMPRAELVPLAEQRGVVVVGTGKDGYVTVEDLRSALDAAGAQVAADGAGEAGA